MAEDLEAKIIVGILFIIFILVVYITAFFLPIIGAIAEWFNSLATMELIIVILSVAVLLSPIVLYKFFKEINGYVIAGLLILLIIIGIIIHGVVAIPASGSYINDNYVKNIDEPINVVMARIVPLKTAYAYAVSELQVPTHTIYESESYVYYNGSIPLYNWIVEPEGTLNEWTKDAEGVILVTGEYPPKVIFVKKPLTWSLHRGRFGIVYWNLLYGLKTLRISEQPIFEDNMEVLLNGSVYILIPFKTWEKTITASIPRLSGYAIITEDGKISFVPADELMENEITRSIFSKYRIPILPEVVAREWVELLRWTPGWGAVVLYHQTFEIRDVGSNPQPYLVYDEEGHLWWLFTVEPSGESYAVKYLIYVDAESTKPKILIYEPEKSWIGASKVEEYVKRAHPVFDWSQFSIEEPIPLVINGTLYWKVSIITKDGRGLVSIDLVNAETGEVHTLEVKKKVTVDDFYRFIDTEILHKPVSPLSNQTTGNQTIYERIEVLKKRIQEMQEMLKNMYRELEELEQLLQTNTTETNSTRTG